MAAPRGSEVWRDYVADGIPSSGANSPKKADIRSWSSWLENLVTSGVLSSGPWFATSAAATLNYPANTVAVVYNDPTAANNGLYIKVGASGVGYWTQLTSFLPGYQFVTASPTGASTANAIVASTSPRLPAGDGVALVTLAIPSTNTASPVTVRFDGGAVLTVKTRTGEDPDAGELQQNDVVAGFVSGATFRLISDLNSLRNFQSAKAWANNAEDVPVSTALGGDGVRTFSAKHWAAKSKEDADRSDDEADRAEVARVGAESYRDQAAGYVNDIVSEKEVPITATRNGMESLQFPAGMNSLETRGYAVMGDGGGAQYRLAISEPAHGLKVQSEDGSWWEAVTNGGINVAIAGAFPGGDVTTRIQAIADYLALKGGGEILFTQPGTYTISSVNLYGKTSVYVGDGVTIQHKVGAVTAMFLAQGAKSGVQLPIAATVSADATSLQLVDASSISAGDWIILKDTTDYSTDGAAVGYKSGESLIVKSKAGNTLNFDRKIFGSFQSDRAYTAARGAHVEKVIPLAGVRVYGPGSIRGHQTFNVGPLEFAYVDDVAVEGVRISNFGGCGVLFRTCRNIVAKPRHVSDGRNDVGAGFPGYGVATWGACDIVLIADMVGTRTRHVFTTMGSADGASTSVHVDRCQAYENDFTAFDTHEGVHDITFSDCKARGGNAANSAGGFFSRAPETRFLDCETVGVPGRGIGAAGQALRYILIQGGLVDGSGGDGLGIPASCDVLRINGIDVWRSGGNGLTLMSGGSNENFPSVIDISDVNIRGFGLSVANRSGISGTTTFASVVNIDDVTVDGGGGSAARGVYITGALVSGKVSRVKARGSYSINPVQVPFSMDNMDHEIDGVPTKLNVAIPDDGVYFIKGASSAHVQYSISSAGSGANLPNGIFTARTSGTPQCFGITSFGANVSFVTGTVLTGTTGTDGNMTISATSTGVYIENRTGASVTINLAAAPSLRR
ncbi:hypothetical protein G6M14_08880 [Agrobacterium tumefaciens]|uniref:hypothetical protein n=1 Tax=Agrobacterium tumefaciens TaxID=358 RepID=UPI0015733DFF|nr:hypothetical protein [Agrobacterium tumefaciens]